jgi:hypothetical protein
MAKKRSKKRAQIPEEGRKRAAPKRAGISSIPSLSGGDLTIKYRCIGGKSCTVTPRKAHMNPEDVVVLTAVNTDVTITFGLEGTPFESQETTFTISAGQSRIEVVIPEADGSYSYKLTCPSCTGGATPMAPPEMIVP